MSSNLPTPTNVPHKGIDQVQNLYVALLNYTRDLGNIPTLKEYVRHLMCKLSQVMHLLEDSSHSWSRKNRLQTALEQVAMQPT